MGHPHSQELRVAKKSLNVSLNVCIIYVCVYVFVVGIGAQSVMTTVTPLAACAPMTSACAMSAVFDGPLIKQP